jgi:hypothetical protein
MSEQTISVITAFATSAAALAAAAAVVVALWGIKKQNAQSERSREDFKLSLSADLSMKLDDSFGSEHFGRIRSDAARALIDGSGLIDAEDVFDFFETVGLLVRTNALTKELAYNFFFHWVNLYWIAGQDHIMWKRTGTKAVWQDFEALYVALRKLEESKDPNSDDLTLADNRDRLTELLKEELLADYSRGLYRPE